MTPPISAIYWHPDCQHHQNIPSYHPEAPERIEAIQTAIQRHPTLSQITWHEAYPAKDDEILRVHTSQYWHRLQNAIPEHADWMKLDQDTGMNKHSLRAARLSAGTVINAVNAMANGEIQRAFCLTRPPGHHAMPSFPMGFCLLSNVAIAAKHAQAQGFKRVAIVDFDAHHGNGTAVVARQTPDILLLSSFQHPHFPQVSLRAEAHQRVILMPLPAQTNGTEFLTEWQKIGLPALRDFRPDLILFSAGFDGHSNDPLAQLALQAQDFATLTNEVKKIATEFAQGRMISALEGGYKLPDLANSTTAHLESLFT